MGFPVQVCPAGVLAKLLIMTVAISISMLARSLFCWLLGSSYFFDDDEELHISSIGTQYVASIYAHDDDDDDDNDSVDDAWLHYSLEVPAMLHTSRLMRPHAANIAHLNETDATSFIDTHYVEAIHGQDDDDVAVPRTSMNGAAMQNAMLRTSCRMHQHGAPVYPIANLDEPDTEPEDNVSAQYDNCCVCLCRVHPSSGKQLPRCAHVLHSSCLDAWLHHGQVKVCPLCRAPTSID